MAKPKTTDFDTFIVAEDLNFSYCSEEIILKDLSLRIEKGEHLTIVGPSGCGKSTLLALIAGRIDPNSGEISQTENVATIYQDLRLVSQRSALENVLHGALGRTSKTFFLPASEMDQAELLLRRVGLGHRRHVLVSDLSGGEKQRVAIARALMQGPEVILADEPIASLDEENAIRILSLLRRLTKERGITLVSVQHDVRLAEKFSDRVVRLANGEIADSNKPLPVFHVVDGFKDRPKTEEEPKELEGIPLARRSALQVISFLLVLGFFYAMAISALDIKSTGLSGVLAGLKEFVANLIPNSSEQLSKIPFAELSYSLWETILMAFVSTVSAVVISLPFSALAAKNIGPKFLCQFTRFILNAIRTVPSIIWALLFVAAVGLGPMAGILALIAYSIGYLSKFFYEGFELVDPAPPEALKEIGANGLQRFRFSVWPQALPAVLTSALFMLEYNIRAASVLGIVDAGGIGFYLKQYIDYRFFPAVTAGLVMILAVVMLFDWLSSKLRQKLLKVRA